MVKMKLTKLKTFSRTLAGKVAIFGAVTALVAANFGPIMRAFAAQPPSQDYAILAFQNVNNIPDESNVDEINVGLQNGSLRIAGSGLYSNEGSTVYAPAGSQVLLDVNGTGEYEGRLWVDGQQNGSTHTLTDLVSNGVVNIDVEFIQAGVGPEPQEGNTEAVVRLRGSEGSYDEIRYDENGEEIDRTQKSYSETYIETSFAINNGMPFQMMPEDAVENTSYSETTYRYNSEEGDDTVDINIETRWHMRFVDTIIINNHPYQVSDFINYDDRDSYLEHYNGQMVGFVIENVAKADVYDIEVKVEKSEHTWIGTFLWTADPGQEWEVERDGDGRLLKDEDGNYIYVLDENGERKPSPNYIGHSRIEPVAVSYELSGKTYSCNLDTDTCFIMVNPEEEDAEIEYEMQCSISEDEECGIPYTEYGVDPEVEYDDGSLTVPANSRVTMRIIPDYGYQVMNVNMSELEVSDDGIGEFTFTVPEGAAYFVADVVEMEDTVKVATDLVSEGTISLGDDQTTLDHGSAQLNVADVELNAEDIEGFAEAAEGYEVKNYLDISLFNITCKGAEVCTGTDEDAWVDQIKDLNEPATITLQLGEGVDGNEIVIVHQKHDGTYEVIPTIYDPETHTITFTTTSFSNYAIASRTVESPDTGSFTGDGGLSETNGVLAAIVTAVIVTGAAMVVAIKFSSRREK